MHVRMVSSNLSFIFHHSQAMIIVLDIFVSVETPQSGVRGVKHVRSICVLHRRPEGADIHPRRQRQLAVMCAPQSRELQQTRQHHLMHHLLL